MHRALIEGGNVQGGKVASEQLQPVYEVKTIVQQNSQRLAGLEQRAKVTSRALMSPTIYIRHIMVLESCQTLEEKQVYLCSTSTPPPSPPHYRRQLITSVPL